uniref:C2H2-type domain-containing protein n=1 Tax=Chenopodium quinoa TaxID=63459 RepID=A0A803MYT7_CHEQI
MDLASSWVNRCSEARSFKYDINIMPAFPPGFSCNISSAVLRGNASDACSAALLLMGPGVLAVTMRANRVVVQGHVKSEGDFNVRGSFKDVLWVGKKRLKTLNRLSEKGAFNEENVRGISRTKEDPAPALGFAVRTAAGRGRAGGAGGSDRQLPVCDKWKKRKSPSHSSSSDRQKRQRSEEVTLAPPGQVTNMEVDSRVLSPNCEVTRCQRIFRGTNGYLRELFLNISEAMRNMEEFNKPDVQALGTLRVYADEIGQTLGPPPGFNLVFIGKEKQSSGLDSSTQNCILRVDGSWDKRSGHYGIGWTVTFGDDVELEGGGDFGAGISAIHAEALPTHECSICHKCFPTGQALGGHKRCHYDGSIGSGPTKSGSRTASGVTASEGVGSTISGGSTQRDFDLNMPALPEFLSVDFFKNRGQSVFSRDEEVESPHPLKKPRLVLTGAELF